jgi:hypothetical protein
MRSFALLLTIFCFLCGFSQAANVTGTLSYAGGSGAATGKKVYLADSTFTSAGVVLLDSAITSSSGGYSITVPSTTSSGHLFLYTLACGYYSSTPSYTYSGSSLTINFGLPCSLGVVSGTVYYGGANPIGAGFKVYLVDTSYTTSSVIYRDSAYTNASGFYSITLPSSVSTGNIRIYAMACGSTWYSAYYGWTGVSRSISLSLGCFSQYVTDTVKNSTSGLPVLGQKVYIMDSTATVYYKDSALTNMAGLVGFSVPLAILSGTFKVYTNACGLQTQNFTYSGSSMIGPTLLVCTSNATVSGTVTNVTTSAGIAGQPVTLIDSSGSAIIHYDSTNTNSSGLYSFTIPAYINTGKMIVSTHACGAAMANSATFTGSNLTLNLSVCATSTATISGTVSNIATYAFLPGIKVYLTDTNVTTHAVTYYDSTTTNSSGFYSFTIPPSFTTGWFYIKVPTCGAVMTKSLRYYSGSSLTESFLVCSSSAPSAVVSGTVLVGAGTAVAGTLVSITGYTRVATTTNSSGGYSIAIPNSWPVCTFMWKDSGSCGTNVYWLNYNGANITKSDTLCAILPIQGYVSYSASPYGGAAGAKVYLIGEQYDFTVTPTDTLLVAYDSTNTTSSGVFSFANSAAYWGVRLRIKSALPTGHTYYSGFLPSYADSALTWRNAQIINASSPGYSIVHLRAGTNPGGPGFIGGSVLLGANKNVGDPLEGRLLMLTTAAGNGVAYTYSDATGHFSFSNLPLGTYQIFGDVWGKNNPPLTVTISAGNTSVANVIFEERSHVFEGHIGNLNVPKNGGLTSVYIYPNPAGSQVTLVGLDLIKGRKTVVLTDINGRLISKVEFEDGKAGNITTEKLSAGMYLLQVTTQDGTANFKLTKQ